MAMSGIKIDAEVKDLFDEVKLKSTADRLKIVTMMISDNLVKVHQKIKSNDLCGCDAVTKLFECLGDKECCYVLYDCCYDTDETQKEELIFIQWCPDEAKVKDKMIYAATAEAVRRVFNGCKHFWQMNEYEQRHPNWIKEQLATCTNHIKALEGKHDDHQQRHL